jgi:hypothetical protein
MLKYCPHYKQNVSIDHKHDERSDDAKRGKKALQSRVWRRGGMGVPAHAMALMDAGQQVRLPICPATQRLQLSGRW